MSLVRTTYTAIYEQSVGGGWHATLAEETRVGTEGRTLVQTRALLRSAAALWFHQDPTSFDLADDVRLPEAIRSAVQDAVRDREAAQAAQKTAVASSRQAARLLVRAANLSLRDAAELLGMSHQRVQQLLD